MITQAQNKALQSIKGLSLNDGGNIIYKVFGIDWGENIRTKVILKLDDEKDMALIYDCIDNIDIIDLLYSYDLNDLIIYDIDTKENTITLYVNSGGIKND